MLPSLFAAYTSDTRFETCCTRVSSLSFLATWEQDAQQAIGLK